MGVFSLALGLSALIGAASAQADDIDFYLLPPSDPVAPNVLFILDESGSMDDYNRMTDLKNSMKTLLDNPMMDHVQAAIMGYTTANTDIYYNNRGWNTYANVNGSLAIKLHSDFKTVGEGSNRSAMKAIVDGLSPRASTPTVWALKLGMEWFDSRATQIEGTPSDRTRATSPTYSSPMSDPAYWCVPNHLVLLTDGEPNSNDPNYYGLTSYKGTTCVKDSTSIEEKGRCAAEIAAWGYNNDLRTDSVWEDNQNVTTHTIALGDSLGSNDKAFLKNIAIKGGGGYYEADNASTLLNAFETIVDDAKSEVEYIYNAPVIPVSATNASVSGDYIYVPLFAPEPNKLWLGNVKKYKMKQQKDGTFKVFSKGGSDAVNVNGMFLDNAKNFWDTEPDGDGGDVLIGGAAGQIGDEPRNLYTWLDGNDLDLTDDNNRLHRDNLLEENDGGVIKNILLTSHSCSENRTEYENCSCTNDSELRDNKCCKKDSNGKWKCRDKWKSCQPVIKSEISCPAGDLLDWMNFTGTHTYSFVEMGAPLHTQPLLVRYASGDVVYQPTSQGLLHAFDEATGKEKWAFMPDELLHTIDDARINAALGENESRLYGLDGPMVLVHDDPNKNGTVDSREKAYLLVSMRRGGRNIYALDISNSSVPKLAWEIKGGVTSGFEKLAQTWSAPQIGKIKGYDGTVVAFGGGYDEDQDAVTGSRQNDDIGNAIYIVDAWTGSRVKTITNSGGDINISNMNNGIVSGVRLLDINNDGYSERLYAADVGGRIIRVDLEANNGAGAGGILADVNEGSAAGNRRFFTEPEIGYLSWGARYLVIAIGSGNRPDPLSNTVTDRFYVIKDYDIFQEKDWQEKDENNLAAYPYDHNDFTDITSADLSKAENGSQSVTVQNVQSRKGWFYTLSAGEKTLSKALIANYAAMFTTYSGTRSDDISPCEAKSTTGVSRFYALDLRHGGSRFDLDLDDSLDTDDRSIVITSIGGLPPPPTLFFTGDTDDEGSADDEGSSDPTQVIAIAGQVITLVGLDEVVRWSDSFKAIYWEQLIDATDDALDDEE
ncbi:pilus assembly protein [Allochromatium vinosum]|uniref:pilus assembly protein n=1 Tax=Allochromatium vinosum TaxID=1049 RepID=UPI00167FB6CF|nr:PilC/PilY family type IV pilus protein [Allochromatium vinosum]